MNRSRTWQHLGTAWHLLFLLASVAYGSWRLELRQREQVLPTPQIEPATFAPRNSRPHLVDPLRLQRVLDRLRPEFAGRRPKINHVDHALRMWGMGAEFSGEGVWSASDMRALLLDHRVFIDAWGESAKPFLIPDTRDAEGLRFRTRSGSATSSHVDHTLAGLAEVGTPLDYPVLTPRGEVPLRAAFDQAVRDFSLNQEEYEWSTMVFLHYLPHQHQWYSTEGQLITWDRLADRLMRQRLNQGVCYGQHRLYVLAGLLQHDDTFGGLSPEVRQRILAHLRDTTDRLTATQHAEGWWDGDWPGDEWDGPSAAVEGPLGHKADRILATGHTLEWWAYAPADVLPDDAVLRRAIDWLLVELEGLTPSEVTRFYPFLTHAGRALALWSGHEPYDAWRAAAQ